MELCKSTTLGNLAWFLGRCAFQVGVLMLILMIAYGPLAYIAMDGSMSQMILAFSIFWPMSVVAVAWWLHDVEEHHAE